MITVSFIGDVMLGRFVAEKYSKAPYQLIDSQLLDKLRDSDFYIANLESPIKETASNDSLKFSGNKELLEQFKWIDCFSLSNNHINDFGEPGMKATVEALEDVGIEQNGLYKKEYHPFLIEADGEKIAVVTCADMMNYEFADDCSYKTLRVNKPQEIIECIKCYKEKGFLVVLFAHVGMLFTRYPNPVIREFAHNMVEVGVDCIVTAHPHCFGGYEYVNGKLIVYSLGDFLMDGASFRRRKAGVLKLQIAGGELKSWSVLPVQTNDDLVVSSPDERTKKQILSDFEKVSKKISNHTLQYDSFYKRQYKKELISHSLSTIKFEYHRRGIVGLFKILAKRFGAVKGMASRVFTDRSRMSYDSDAVGENNISINDIR